MFKKIPFCFSVLTSRSLYNHHVGITTEHLDNIIIGLWNCKRMWHSLQKIFFHMN